MHFPFFFQCLSELIWPEEDGIAPPRVVVTDQGSGMMAALPSALPGAISQLCEWHAAENIRAKVAAAKYSLDERKDIHDLTWDYIKSNTPRELEVNRERLYALLADKEIDYIKANWVPKEERIIRCWTKRYPNLGVHGTQRNEGMHPIIGSQLNAQLSLEDVVRRLAQAVGKIYQRLA